jgi:hypothetical protein
MLLATDTRTITDIQGCFYGLMRYAAFRVPFY